MHKIAPEPHAGKGPAPWRRAGYGRRQAPRVYRYGGKGKSFSVNGGERRPLLTSYRVSDPGVQWACSLADKNRAVLDKLFCYWQCSRPPFLHKSLLSCYAETHAAEWMICLEQARWAARGTAQGKIKDEVRRLNDRRFG